LRREGTAIQAAILAGQQRVDAGLAPDVQRADNRLKRIEFLEMELSWEVLQQYSAVSSAKRFPVYL
jgi:hypothetical protein